MTTDVDVQDTADVCRRVLQAYLMLASLIA
jgi:hypothetical protein